MSENEIASVVCDAALDVNDKVDLAVAIGIALNIGVALLPVIEKSVDEPNGTKLSSTLRWPIFRSISRL
jgi:hypothetical protein